MGIVERYLLQLKTEKRRWRRAAVVLTALSLLVVAGVSWNLRMTGITLVNDACCGYPEHQHTEACLMPDSVPNCGEFAADPQHVHTDACYPCGYVEHFHSLSCYSNPNADVETQLDWQELFSNYP